MDEGVLGQYKEFLRSAAGIDLIDRLKSTEATFMMSGMKTNNMEGKALAMAKMEATYSIRTMLDDIATTVPKEAKNESKSKV